MTRNMDGTPNRPSERRRSYFVCPKCGHPKAFLTRQGFNGCPKCRQAGNADSSKASKGTKA